MDLYKNVTFTKINITFAQYVLAFDCQQLFNLIQIVFTHIINVTKHVTGIFQQ